MKLFTPIVRESIKNEIIDIAQAHEDVVAAFLVGSAVLGFTDELSDIDMVIVVKDSNCLPSVMTDIRAAIAAQYEPLTIGQVTERRLQVYLLWNYLEINISYQPAAEVSKTRERTKVMFDKTDTISAKLEESWRQNKMQQAPCNAEGYAEHTWHFLFHAAIALKHGQYWRCMTEMDIVRGRLMELKCRRYGLVSKRGRDIDKFPQDDLTAMQITMVTVFAYDAMLQNLHCLANLVYDELEIVVPHKIEISRQDVIEYITLLLGEIQS